MVTIKAEEGIATYTVSPYPHWLESGDQAMVDRGEAILDSLSPLIDDGTITWDNGFFYRDLFDAFVDALKLSEITIVEYQRPGPDPPPGLVH